MRIAALVDFDLGVQSVEYFSHPFALADAACQRDFDLLIADFRYLANIYEMRSFFTYIIFLHPLCDATTYARALRVGDYCYRYEAFEHLKSRIAYLQRRESLLQGRLWRQGKFYFDRERKKLYHETRELELSQALQELLLFLIENRDRYVDKYAIIDNLESINTEGSLKVAISRLRSLGLEIETRQGLGYKLKENE